MTITAFRSSLLHFPRQTARPEQEHEFFEDGCLVVENGKILAIGEAKKVLLDYPQAKVKPLNNKLILPGLIDSHLHFPQTEMIASYGEQLLEWLTSYTFPVEQRFSDSGYADHIAQIFLRQLLKNGTTTAMVYSSVHKQATDALFSASSQLGMAMIAGKVCMDRNCPDALQDTPESAQRDSAELIEKWHGKQRQYYALTPRFAPTSSPDQMAALGELAKQYPDVYIQTHLSENKQEIAWVKELYPSFEQYLDVYAHYNMVRPGAVFGHCLHLHPSEWSKLASSGATIAFCPTSNLFLGSGLFDLKTAKEHQIHVSLATDVGGGTSFNMFRTLGEAYKICQLQKFNLNPLLGLYMMTQGAAKALNLDHQIGNLNPGTDADFIVVDPAFDELSELRTAKDMTQPQNLIFALSMLADDRAISSTWVAGKCCYQKNKEQ